MVCLFWHEACLPYEEHEVQANLLIGDHLISHDFSISIRTD